MDYSQNMMTTNELGYLWHEMHGDNVALHKGRYIRMQKNVKSITVIASANCENRNETSLIYIKQV